MEDRDVSLDQLKNVYKAQTEAYLEFNMALISIVSNQKDILAKVENKQIGYDWMKFIEHFDFIVCISNTSSRKRENFKGVVKAVKSGTKKSTNRYEGH